MKKENIVMFSGGKDSTAQVLLMLENNIPMDDIVMCDLGKEFPEIYDHKEKFEKYIGQKITVIKPDKPFIYWLALHYRRKGKRPNEFYYDKETFEKKILTKKDFDVAYDGTPIYKDYVGVIRCDTNVGYGFPDMRNRWCTGIKVQSINKYLKEKPKRVEWHGIAFDEQNRIEKNKGRDIRYILNEMKYTEEMALQLCYDHGFDFGGLYKIMNRVSCYCCPLQSISDLRYLYNQRKELWDDMLFMESQSFRKFTATRTLKDFESMFDNENNQLKIF